MSAYCATKWAIEGFSESVKRELNPEWNIKMMIVEPGEFKTDATNRSVMWGENEQMTKVYGHFNAGKVISDIDSSQQGDPVKGAQALHALCKLKDPPQRCVLGADADAMVQFKMKLYQGMYSRKDVTEAVTATNF